MYRRATVRSQLVQRRAIEHARGGLEAGKLGAEDREARAGPQPARRLRTGIPASIRRRGAGAEVDGWIIKELNDFFVIDVGGFYARCPKRGLRPDVITALRESHIRRWIFLIVEASTPPAYLRPAMEPPPKFVRPRPTRLPDTNE